MSANQPWPENRQRLTGLTTSRLAILLLAVLLGVVAALYLEFREWSGRESAFLGCSTPALFAAQSTVSAAASPPIQHTHDTDRTHQELAPAFAREMDRCMSEQGYQKRFQYAPTACVKFREPRCYD